jgi:hypothetical protein
MHEVANNGVLRGIVWPVYIGCALAGTTPPFSIDEPHNGGYERGVIHWEPTDIDEIVGRARIILAPGTYTHFCFFKHPTSPHACGVAPMDFPITARELVMLDVYPIRNADLALSKGGNVR